MKLLPFIEVNNSESILIAKGGLEVWEGPEIIISTVPGRVNLINDLQNGPISIIKGLKTKSKLPTFDNIKGWEIIANEIRIFGSTPILLENETAIKPYLRKDLELNWKQFKKAIHQLPKDTQYWLEIGSTNSFKQKWFLEYIRVWSDEHNIKIIDTTWGDRRTYKSAGVLKFREQLKDFLVIPKIFPQNKSYYWKVNEIPFIYEQSNADMMVLYPGLESWPEMARKIKKELNGKNRSD